MNLLLPTTSLIVELLDFGTSEDVGYMILFSRTTQYKLKSTFYMLIWASRCYTNLLNAAGICGGILVAFV